MNTEHAVIIHSAVSELDAALAELEGQGLTIRSHNKWNSAWHIADGGLYSGYVASGDELILLGRTGKLNMQGIMNLS